MRALVFSDIHGSMVAAHTIKEQAEKIQPDVILLLGDLLYHGPRNPLPKGYDPPATARILNSFADKIIAVGGNCDSEVDTAVLTFPIAPAFSWFYADGIRLFLTHGHLYSPDSLPPLREGDLFLYGHTHIPAATTQGQIYLCNPGSLALPKEGHPPSYGLLQHTRFSVLTQNEEAYLHLVCC